MMVVVSLIQDTHVINRYLQSPCRSLLALPTCGGLQRAHASPQLLLHDARCRMIFLSLFKGILLLTPALADKSEGASGP